MSDPSDTPQPTFESLKRKTVIIPHDEKPADSEQYDVVQEIAAGGMGVVYLARDRKLGRHVALKRLSQQFWANSIMKERFLREAKSIAALNHAHIVHVYALAEDRTGPYIAMEYVPGPGTDPGTELPGPPLTLEAKVRADGPMPVEDAIGVMIKLCNALSYAHERGVIHRDLKPSNVLLTEDEEPKIVDFGLARHRHGPGDEITATGTKMVSLGYSAPEQESDASSVDERADIYSLGGVLYFCLTGENPRFFRENRVPEPLRPSILKALESDLNQRWAKIADFEESLFHSGIIVPDRHDRGTWWCKWCHAINPLSRRFCVDCGWDGLEYCGECGAETRIGVQYCGSCGNDAKTFEEAARLYDRLKTYEKEGKFHLLREEAGQIPFQPKGETGRNLIAEILDLQRHSEKALARREELLNLIPTEFKREKFERTKEFLEEFKVIDATGKFMHIEQELPFKLAQRDLTRARVEYNLGNIDQAERLCRGILDNADLNHAETELFMRQIRLRKQLHKMKGRVIMGLCIFVIYFSSMGPVTFWAAGSSSSFRQSFVNTVYRPVTWCADHTILKKPLNWITNRWAPELEP